MGTSHFSLASCLKDRWIIYRKVIGNKKLLVRAGIEREGRLSTDSPTPIADLSARSRKYVLLYTSSKESRSRKMHDGKSGKTKPSCTQNEKAKHILILTYSCGAQSVTNKHLTFHHLLFQKDKNIKYFLKEEKRNISPLHHHAIK